MKNPIESESYALAAIKQETPAGTAKQLPIVAEVRGRFSVNLDAARSLFANPEISPYRVLSMASEAMAPIMNQAANRTITLEYAAGQLSLLIGAIDERVMDGPALESLLRRNYDLAPDVIAELGIRAQRTLGADLEGIEDCPAAKAAQFLREYLKPCARAQSLHDEPYIPEALEDATCREGDCSLPNWPMLSVIAMGV
jgi:hypothetical protein